MVRMTNMIPKKNPSIIVMAEEFRVRPNNKRLGLLFSQAVSVVCKLGMYTNQSQKKAGEK